MTDDMSFLRRFRAAKTGTMTVEFVLVLPVFLLFVLFTIEAGRFVASRAELSYALQAMARDALLATSLDRQQLTQRLAARFALLRSDAIQSLDIAETVNPDRTRWVDLNVSYRFEFLLPALVGKEFVLLASHDRFLRE
jgi:Flp pilus assembly protein TadG